MLQHRLHVVIYPAPDLPGQWLSHCLELDLISQGNTPVHTLDMMAEAIQLCADENVREGRPPLAFRSAPSEIWEMAGTAEEVTTRILHLSPASLPDDVTLAPFIIGRAG